MSVEEVKGVIGCDGWHEPGGTTDRLAAEAIERVIGG